MIPFWITFSERWQKEHGCAVPIGLGVTAHDLPEAIRIVERFVFLLPESEGDLIVHEDISFEELGRVAGDYVLDHMGPMPVHGIWYPFTGIRSSS